MLRLGIMGGTFDPLHWVHLIIAEEARAKFDLHKVIFIPAGEPPHKPDYRISDPETRYAMVVIGTASNPAFEVSRIEMEREGPSYSVDTLEQLKAIHGTDAALHFIVGADEALDLPCWHEAGRLPSLTRFIVAPRPGFDLTDLQSRLPAEIYRAVDLLPMMASDVSATDIRARVASGHTIRYLVPGGVEAFIRKRGLYIEDSDI